MYLVKINVTYKESILDPQGQSICQAAHQLDFPAVTDVRMGKYFEVALDCPLTEVATTVAALCDTLLVNATMETYQYEVQEEVLV